MVLRFLYSGFLFYLPLLPNNIENKPQLFIYVGISSGTQKGYLCGQSMPLQFYPIPTNIVVPMKYIDLDTWSRKEHFNFFYRMDYPQYNICFNLDVTRFLAFTREKKLSFYYAMIFAVTDVVNQYDDFKYRIRKGQVVMHDLIHPSFTDMNGNSQNDLFKMVTVDMKDSLIDFEKATREISRNQSAFMVPEKLAGRDDVIYITCIPWISFTHVSHTISINRDDSVPRISWGKYFKQEDKVWLPFSVQVHHALLDGYHIGKYAEKLQQYLDEIG
jgi:chloramphenicol O-acetyltransferase type A